MGQSERGHLWWWSKYHLICSSTRLYRVLKHIPVVGPIVSLLGIYAGKKFWPVEAWTEELWGFLRCLAWGYRSCGWGLCGLDLLQHIPQILIRFWPGEFGGQVDTLSSLSRSWMFLAVWQGGGEFAGPVTVFGWAVPYECQGPRMPSRSLHVIHVTFNVVAYSLHSSKRREMCLCVCWNICQYVHHISSNGDELSVPCSLLVSAAPRSPKDQLFFKHPKES